MESIFDHNKKSSSKKERDYHQVNAGLKEDFIVYNNTKSSIKKNSYNLCQIIFFFFFPCMKRINTWDNRYVYFYDKEFNYTMFSNTIASNKYNVITFLPVVLYHQFKYFGNQFYLIMSISQFVDVLKVGFLFSYIAPLAFVLVVTLVKEAYDDIYCYKQDFKTNNEEYTVHTCDKSSGYSTRKSKAENIKIGDVIEITQNQRIPADMVLVKAFNEAEDENNHNLFIRTDQLDGETDWKLRKAPSLTQKLDVQEILDLRAFIVADPPSKMIYEFKGVLNVFDNDHHPTKEALALENTLWSSTILASKKAIGIVVYTGKETRVQMNSSLPKPKVGMLDLEVNTLNKILFIIMIISAFIITALKGFNRNIFETIIVFFRFIVLLCAIIPISLRVNLDISKTLFSALINMDKNIPETIARNSTIPEELGRIEYVFTDKTGTLTKNEMIFKRLSMEADQFSKESFSELTMILQDECHWNNAPLMDMIHLMHRIKDNPINMSESLDSEDKKLVFEETPFKKAKRIRRNRTKVIRDTITAMALCNNVTPIVDTNNPSNNCYQASSPDEVALVKFAEKMSMRLVYRSDKEIKLINAANFTEEYQILANFPFSSETKRMGILIRNRTHGHIIFYLKGAESVIENFVKEEYKGYIKENAENLASIGLRTLVLTQKIVSNEFFLRWFEEYNEALTSMERRKEKVQEVVSKLERNLDFLCVTGVEDLLQDDADSTIENLRNAGMKIWMLTGDKVETATCIAISAGIKAKEQKLFFIRSDRLNQNLTKESPQLEIKSALEKFRYLESNSHVMVIDGDSLEACLIHLEKEFFETALKAASVICCRCSPTQKSKIVRTIKKYTTKCTCAIGDGGNDVAMIQEADVGIGIVGKEGLQASLSSDFSITKFMHLNLLLLWWGRLSYKNTATMAKFVIHRGLIISLIQFIFSVIFYCSAVAIYNGMLILGYSTIYTNLPVIALLLDRDTDMKNVMKFPALYKSLLRGRELSIKSFLWWLWKSIFQASVIMIGAIALFGDFIFLKIVTITFTALIFAELLNVYTEIKTYHRLMMISLIGTLFTYLISLIFLKSILDLYYIFDLMTISKILAIAIASWFPFYLFLQCKTRCYPEAYEKLNSLEFNLEK